ncbi:MAG: FAA hydrolase family protein [Alphaproteobacteria bacterium]|nr:FAA hydrolase family protein [Alphaproteobacteria bacterium]
MRYATVTAPDNRDYFVRIENGIATPIGRANVTVGVDPLRVLFATKKNPAKVKGIAKSFPLAKAKKWHSPVTAPSKVISVGANYRKHIAEVGLAVPELPVSFAKYPSALTGHKQPVKFRRKDTNMVDYENELMIVIGKRAKDVKKKDALKYVFGYTIVNDISARDHQFGGDQYSRCKSFDTFMPVGPWIVGTDELKDPQKLDIRTRVNGKTVQSNNTSDMLFPCARIIEFLSQYMTLEPGDMITTGTPEGVGWGRTPKLFLKDGDTLETEIGGIGVLVNPIKEYK